MKKKRILSALTGVVISFLVFNNTVLGVFTTYNPTAHAADMGQNGFAHQRDNYPWCLVTCLKLVLRDVNDRYPAAGGAAPLPGHLHAATIHSIAPGGGPVPVPAPIAAVPNSRWDIEETFIRSLFLQHNVTGDRDILSRLADGRAAAFTNITNTLFNRHFNGEIAAQAMALVATDVRRFGFFDGLLGTLPVANLQTLWDNLRAPTAIENTVKQISDQALLAEVDRMATNGGGGFAVGGGAGIHDIGASNANYVAAIGQIQTEVVNRHMPILIFQNPRGQRHACVVVQTLTLPGGIIVLRAYNPRGHRFDILSDKRISDMGAGGEENWNLVQYITFNY